MSTSDKIFNYNQIVTASIFPQFSDIEIEEFINDCSITEIERYDDKHGV